MMYVFAAVVVWLVFNWLAPYSMLVGAERMSAARIAPEIAERARQLGVRMYIKSLMRPGGLSILAWPRKLVFFDRDSLSLTPAWAWRFLIAHELGHCALGHVQKRWWMTVTGIALLPAAQQWLQRMEREADAYAERLVGIAAESFYGHTHKEINA